MPRLYLVILAFLAGTAAAADPTQPGFRLDLSAGAAFPLTWYDGGPALRHFGGGGALGAEYDLASWIPARLELAYFKVGPSAISEGGELYRAWKGLRIAACAGYRFAPLPELGNARLGILAGGAITAAGYTGTNLAFAYPSALAELRLDLSSARNSSLWLGIPLEYMFRGAFRTASAGLVAGWRMGPLPEAAQVPARRAP